MFIEIFIDGLYSTGSGQWIMIELMCHMDEKLKSRQLFSSLKGNFHKYVQHIAMDMCETNFVSQTNDALN